MNIIETAQALFKDLEKAKSIATISKAMKRAVKALDIQHDTEEMTRFLVEQQAKYQKPTVQATKEFQKFGLTVQRTRAFISVFSAYDDIQEVRNVYYELLAKQK